jgi:hypothetical protein
VRAACGVARLSDSCDRWVALRAVSDNCPGGEQWVSGDQPECDKPIPGRPERPEPIQKHGVSTGTRAAHGPSGQVHSSGPGRPVGSIVPGRVVRPSAVPGQGQAGPIKQAVSWPASPVGRGPLTTKGGWEGQKSEQIELPAGPLWELPSGEGMVNV